MSVSVRMACRLAGLVALALVLGTGRGASQSPPPRVLVMPFVADADDGAPGGVGTSLWLGEAAAVLIADALAGRGVDTFDRSERVAAFDHLQLPMSSALTRATMIRVGELIGATDVVFGSVRLGDQLQVVARLVDLTTGTERPAVVDASAPAEIFALFGRVAGHLAATGGGPGNASSEPPFGNWPPEAFENYVKGLVAATPASQQRFLETALAAAPGEPRIAMALWDVYSTEDRHDRALAVANMVPAESRLWPSARFAVAQSLIALGRLDGAYQELAALDAQQPTAAVANALGVVQLRRGPVPGTDPAAAFFARAAGSEPDNATYLFNLGYAYARVGRPADALEALREAVRLDAADGDARLVMSAVLAGAGDPTLAARQAELAELLGTSFERSGAEATPGVPAGLERLASDLEASAFRSRDVTALARQDERETAAFYLAQGRALVEAGRDREATDALRRAIYLSPDDPEAHLLLGRVYYRTGQTAEAIDEFKVSLWSQESAEARLALGTALFDAGDVAGARREATRALELLPGSDEARQLLARTAP